MRRTRLQSLLRRRRLFFGDLRHGRRAAAARRHSAAGKVLVHAGQPPECPDAPNHISRRSRCTPVARQRGVFAIDKMTVAPRSTKRLFEELFLFNLPCNLCGRHMYLQDL